jgi:aminoglycoside phosphotransferase (APT) family kinase protein
MNTDTANITGPVDDLDLAFLRRCFRHHLACDEIRILKLDKFPRGVSRETWFVSCELTSHENIKVQDFMLRRDLPGGSICSGDLRSEYEVYKRLNGSGVPVAETLWYEDDPELLEGHREFYIRRHVQGDWNIPNLLDPDPAHNELRIAIGREHVRCLAQLHSCDWQQLGFDEIFIVPDNADDCARLRVEILTAEIARLQVQPLPLVTEAEEWFIDNQPPSSGHICLLKGTNGFGEEVFLDRKIVAMSDWEMACLGDPAMDFAMAQNFLDEVHEDGKCLWGQQPALDYYHSLTGIHINPETITYYKRLYGLNRIQFSQAAARQLQMQDQLCRLPWLAVEVLHLGQIALANAIGCIKEPLPEMGQRG